MPYFSTLGLRGRLILPLLAAFVMLVGVMGWQSLNDREARLRAASDSLLGKVKLIALGKQVHIAPSGSPLDWLAQEFSQARLPEGARLTLVDEDGTVLARYPDPQAWATRSVAGHSLFQRIRDGASEGMVEETGLNGVRQLVAYTPLPTGNSGRSYRLWLAVPKEIIVAEDERDLWFSFALALTVLAATLGAVYWGGERFVVRPLEILSRTATRFGAGEMDARSGLPHGDDEIGRLARSVDETAAALQSKELMLIENQRQLTEAKEMAEAATQAKSQFLAHVSHELRSPLNSLLILAQLLFENREGNLTPKQVKFAEVIHDAGTDLLHFINDLLDLAKIESGRASIHCQPLSFREALEAFEPLFRTQTESKGLSLEISLAADLPARIVTDGEYLQPILRNLLSNAIKFTERGGVSLRVHRTEGGWSSTHPVLSRAAAVIAFEVSDSGIGIAADNLQRIFEAFEQTGDGAQRRYGGTGLGLHIARQNACLLGGEIGVASTLGQGSTFTLYLPLDFAGEPNAPLHGAGVGS